MIASRQSGTYLMKSSIVEEAVVAHDALRMVGGLLEVFLLLFQSDFATARSALEGVPVCEFDMLPHRHYRANTIT